MPDANQRGPVDQGLFLTHFNKGREAFEARRFEEAEQQLEEAYLLRPRDARVLNLLGLVYFRGEKLVKAEEVYRKLIAQNPDAHTLYYNLGLICFKLQRLEDAEQAFRKALELGGAGNAKIEFYLGSIYERLGRYKDAIYNYRQAGASVLVQRVQGKLDGEPAPAAAAETRPDAHVDPAAEQGDTRPLPRPRPPQQLVDDKTRPPLPGVLDLGLCEAEVEEGQAFQGKVLQAVSPTLLSADAAPHETAAPRNVSLPEAVSPAPVLAEPAGRATTAPVRAEPARTEPVPAARSSAPAAGTTPSSPADTAAIPPAPVISAPAVSTPALAAPVTTPPANPSDTTPPARPGATQTAAGPAQVFRALQRSLMEIHFSGKVFLKQGTIYSYSGNLTFWVKDERPGGHPALAIVTGTGRLLLTDRDREIAFLQVRPGEPVFVEPSHLLACEEGLEPRFETVAGQTLIALDGNGTVALSVATKPLELPVQPGQPVSVPAASLIGWTGAVTAAVVEDPQVYAVVRPSGAGGKLLRIAGDGRVLVEQAGG